MAGYRNRMVHMYHMISEEELYDIITTELGDIKEFVSEIKNTLEVCMIKTSGVMSSSIFWNLEK
ncbi:Protein of unknown function DUF86 [Caldanaerobius fijiensis DSM 17918]|uniref:DUF86 domain-containing protein n=2 Tax=Caldanaerobius TaxID=862261 RepID=A0A1M5CYL4_9THEO|nr:Protein of unknown function DUF86 [Caldanaerobius fijiensis DSM 17918]